ncbi:hypothetical protein O3M35_005645 [Rhynocoris fuscipes]|uniref:Cytochrome P450 n=1 Tax=Rhynocoris fuscipes TaxID=488301 RepID=A0AAW1DL95_9HEMI
MLVFTVLISVVLSFIIWRTILFIVWVNRTLRMTSNIPITPFFETLLKLGKAQNLEEMYNLFIGLKDTYMDSEDQILRTWVGPKLFLTIGNPKHIETVLSSQDAIQKDSVYEYFTLFGAGPFALNGSRWAELRKPLNKLITKPMIESNLGVFYEKATKLSNILSKLAQNGNSVDMRHYIANYFADTLAVSTFGHELNELEQDKWNLAENIERVISGAVILIAKFPYCLSFALAIRSKEGQKALQSSKCLWSACNEMIDGRLANKQKLGETLDEEPKFYSDIVQQVAKKRNLNKLERGQLAGDVLVGGYDTSAVTAATVLLMLAMFPEHQEGVYNEQINLVGDDTSVPLTWEQLSNMHYLTRVIKETLRRHNPPTIARVAANDIDLGKYKIPKGATIFIILYLLHRHPTCWSHPTEFYPDHFLPEETATRPKSAFYPFSWGPRSCPGKLYAMISMKVLLSILIRKYKFETDLKFEDLKYKFGIMLEVAQGYHLRIKLRHPTSNEL